MNLRHLGGGGGIRTAFFYAVFSFFVRGSCNLVDYFKPGTSKNHPLPKETFEMAPFHLRKRIRGPNFLNDDRFLLFYEMSTLYFPKFRNRLSMVLEKMGSMLLEIRRLI